MMTNRFWSFSSLVNIKAAKNVSMKTRGRVFHWSAWRGDPIATVFVHLDAYCVWAINKKNRKYCHLASLGWNFTGQYLVATGGTTLEQEAWKRCGWWITWFRLVFEQISLWYCLIYQGKCSELLYRQDMIDLKGWFCDVTCVFSAEHKFLLLPLMPKWCSKTSEWRQKEGVRGYSSMRAHMNEYGIIHC